MKFILDKDKLTIVNNKPYTYNSGSVDYYEAEVQFDETWNDLTIEAIITKMGENKGISRSPINNKIMLDLQENGTYTVGFVGYNIENEEKIYQISTNLDIIQYEKGAGEIETENEPILTPTEWEIYIAQIQDMIDNIQTDYIPLRNKPKINNIELTGNKSLSDLGINIPTKISDLTNDSGFITSSVNNLTNYTLKTNTGSFIDLEINQTTYIVTLKLKDVDGNIISTDTIDLPLESVVVSGRYDDNTKKVVLTLENGSEIAFSVADLVAGLQSEINSNNKLSSDFVDDENKTHKFMTIEEKNKLSGLYNYDDTKIKEETEKLRNQYEKGSAEGESITITNCSSLPYEDYKVKGKSEQSGEPSPSNPSEIHSVADDVNLFDASKIANSSIVVTDNGKTIKMPIVSSGNGNTNTSSILSNLCPNLQVGDIVYVRFKRNLNNNRNRFIYLYGSNKSLYGYDNSASYTITQEDLNSYVFLYGNNYDYGETEQCIITDFKIQKNTVPINYSPYNQGTVTIKQRGKNLFDINDSEQGYYDFIIGNSVTKVSNNANWRSKNLITSKTNTQYVLSSSTTIGYLRIHEFDKNLIQVAMTQSTNSNNVFVTTKSNTKYIAISLNYNNSTMTKEIATSLNIQLEQGSVTTYEPYQGYDKTFQTAPLRSLPNGVKDTIEEDGIHRRVGRVVLNGTEYWSLNSSSGDSYRYWLNSNGFKNIFTNIVLGSEANLTSKLLCNYFSQSLFSNTNIGKFSINNLNENNWFLLNVNISTLAAFKTWLSTHNTEVLYPLAEEVIEPLTQNQATTMLDIIQTGSYEGTTNIYTDEDVKPTMEVEYYKKTYTKPSNGIPKSDLDSNVQTSLEKADTALQREIYTGTITGIKMNGTSKGTSGVVDLGTVITSHQDISGKQNIEDNTLTTNNKTIPSAINEVNSIAKGANQALSYGNYSTMVTAFNSLDDDVYNVGQNVMIVTLEVPDLWISGIESTSSTYTYVDDTTIVNALQTNGYIQVGYYKLSMLETQKVDLTDYVKNTDYAGYIKGGVVKANGTYGFLSDANGNPYIDSYNYTQYQEKSSYIALSKGTLENVLTERIGTIDTILETLTVGSGV